jgi:hypothetical protein
MNDLVTDEYWSLDVDATIDWQRLVSAQRNSLGERLPAKAMALVASIHPQGTTATALGAARLPVHGLVVFELLLDDPVFGWGRDRRLAGRNIAVLA